MSGGTAPILTGSARLVNTRTTEKVTHSRPFYDACVSHDVHTPVPARGRGGARARCVRSNWKFPPRKYARAPGVLSRGPAAQHDLFLLLSRASCYVKIVN